MWIAAIQPSDREETMSDYQTRKSNEESGGRKAHLTAITQSNTCIDKFDDIVRFEFDTGAGLICYRSGE